MENYVEAGSEFAIDVTNANVNEVNSQTSSSFQQFLNNRQSPGKLQKHPNQNILNFFKVKYSFSS